MQKYFISLIVIVSPADTDGKRRGLDDELWLDSEMDRLDDADGMARLDCVDRTEFVCAVFKLLALLLLVLLLLLLLLAGKRSCVSEEIGAEDEAADDIKFGVFQTTVKTKG
jgi:hypothetical protein